MNNARCIVAIKGTPARQRTELHFLECGILSRKYCPTRTLRVLRAGADNTSAIATSFLHRTSE